VIGKTGRLTGAVGPGLTGAIILPVRGGSEEFYAYPAIDGQSITTGTRVIVTDFEAPRDVYVAPYGQV